MIKLRKFKSEVSSMTTVIIKIDKPESDKELIIHTKLTPKEIENLIKQLEKKKYETAILSESSLKKDWLKPEEDEAWADL